MNDFHKQLYLSLQTGFIDRSLPSTGDYQPKLLFNSKEDGVKILATIQNELKRCDEFWFSVAFVTKDGVATIIEYLRELEVRKVRGQVLVSQYLNFTQPEALKALLQFSNIELRIVQTGGFHAKGYIFRTGTEFSLVIGSSNLTASALCVNKEWNLKVSASFESSILTSTFAEFNREFAKASIVDKKFIETYSIIYNEYRKALQQQIVSISPPAILPNKMQEDALKNLAAMRSRGVDKALLISATGTGKTYLSAFDAKSFQPKRLLFIVHRENIARASLKSYQKIFGISRTMGLYTGNSKELECDFLFATIQTLSSSKNLYQFQPSEFDYIVVDETHRAGAETYQKVIDHFRPGFLLGMTATPERTDGFDIFHQFGYNIAYEIRLQRALEEEILSNFHYFGVTDLSIDGNEQDDVRSFNRLVADERVTHILDKARIYGCDNGEVRGLVFCSSVKECIELSRKFNQRGARAIALTGDCSEQTREDAIRRIESDGEDKIDYIFTRDIFNEGVDIPRINQVILLRPTESAIVYVQQLGRGLRKVDGKEYLTVIDFIGNHSNNYLVPIALFGDTSYNKDRLRKLMSSGSNLIPGASTVNFDAIAKSRIYKAIDAANMSLKRDLDRDYELLKFQLGRIPGMLDFVEHGSRDPFLYAAHAGSYYAYVQRKEGRTDRFKEEQRAILEGYSRSVANGKRVEDLIVLKQLLLSGSIAGTEVISTVSRLYGYEPSEQTVASCERSINLKFIKKAMRLVDYDGGCFTLTQTFAEYLEDDDFRLWLIDLVRTGEETFKQKFNLAHFHDGFQLYEKYSREDVFRILNWEENPVAQNVGGYIYNKAKTNFTVFVTYEKDPEKATLTDYEDRFLNRETFEMISKNSRSLKSPEITLLQSNVLPRIPFFIKKRDDEGKEFYYLGDMKPLASEDAFREDVRGKEQNIKIVKVRFQLNMPVAESLFDYLTSESH
ncbi:MAG: DUF3427 domain-containing protein [Chitinophagaceae bacterium]|nr:MAG: DUF3427 domain-containing protein [Chitinophagaceae bacterium]